MRAPKVCSTPGCLADADRKAGKCAAHKEKPWVRSTRAQKVTPEFRANRSRVLKDTGGRCAFCGRPTNIVDHRRPLAWGGTDELTNLQPLCADHHQIKTAQEKVLGRKLAQGLVPPSEADRHVDHWTPAIARYR
jgi:5-methylcytosine-specific restriction protein A